MQTQRVPHLIEIRLREPGQLFNTMDPSPFNEKDLDADAEEFILSWAMEFPLREPLRLVVHLPHTLSSTPPIQEAVQHHFLQRTKLMRLELGRMLREARISLLIGLSFLALCLGASSLLAGSTSSTLRPLLRESLTIAGWVAMWRPVQMYLYDWWPLRRRLRVFEKMSQVPVEVRQDAA